MIRRLGRPAVVCGGFSRVVQPLGSGLAEDIVCHRYLLKRVRSFGIVGEFAGQVDLAGARLAIEPMHTYSGWHALLRAR